MKTIEDARAIIRANDSGYTTWTNGEVSLHGNFKLEELEAIVLLRKASYGHLDKGNTEETSTVGQMVVTDEMVTRFLGWRLPDDFMPDCGISFKSSGHPNGWPVGTNLFTAGQARKMLEHILCAIAAPPVTAEHHPIFGKMESLGAPFEEILHDNLFDLYTDTSHPALAAQPVIAPDLQAELEGAALKLLKRIRFHAERHSIPRDWLTAADEVLGTWANPKTTHPEIGIVAPQPVIAPGNSFAAEVVNLGAQALFEFQEATGCDSAHQLQQWQRQLPTPQPVIAPTLPTTPKEPT